MSGKSSSKNAAVIAAVGAGALIGAAGAFLYFTLNNVEEKKKIIRKSVDVNTRKASTQTMRSKRPSECSSRSSYETASERFSSDDEFYDVNSEHDNEWNETRESTSSSEEDTIKGKKERKLFLEVDVLMKGDDSDGKKAFNLLSEYKFEMSENPNFLWRYAKAHEIQAAMWKAMKDVENTKKYVFAGLEYASKALELDNLNPDAHKWFAILTGMQCEFLPLREKILKAILFHKHITIAIEFKPKDYSLHHLLGRFKYELASTSWLERQLATSICGFPVVTDSDALKDVLTAEKLSPTPWKENRLLLAKCYIREANYEKAIQWLNSAKTIQAVTKIDEDLDQEINTLLKKYEKYIK